MALIDLQAFSPEKTDTTIAYKKRLLEAHPLLKAFSSMTDSELRDPKQLLGLTLATGVEFNEEGAFVVESRNVIERALNAGLTPFALISEKRWLEPHKDLFERVQALESAGSDPVPQYIGTHSTIEAITGFKRTVGPIAAFHRPTLPKVDDILANAKRIAVLEDITNYTNIGAIFRSAAALGMDAVLVTPGCHDPYYRRASRVSMGTVFQVPWTRIGDEMAPNRTDAQDLNGNHKRKDGTYAESRSAEKVERTPWTITGIPLLKRYGFTTVALALQENSVRLQDPKIAQAEKLALVLGTEGDGLAHSTIAQCDFTVCIPMAHDVDSLNVAAASAVAFWEVCGRYQ